MCRLGLFGGGIYPWFIVLVGCGIYPCFLGLVQVPPLGGVRGLPVSAVLYVAVRSASAPPPPPSWTVLMGGVFSLGFDTALDRTFLNLILSSKEYYIDIKNQGNVSKIRPKTRKKKFAKLYYVY